MKDKRKFSIMIAESTIEEISRDAYEAHNKLLSLGVTTKSMKYPAFEKALESINRILSFTDSALMRIHREKTK